MSDTLFDPAGAAGTASLAPAAVTVAGRSPDLHRFTVPGHPVAQGSMTGFVDKRSGRVQLKPSNERQLKAWRKLIIDEAQALAEHHGQLTGPLEVDAEFRFQMPPSRSPKAIRDLGRWPMEVQPDIDKLVRAVLDALTLSGLIHDDRQIAVVHASKHEYVASWTGVDIAIRRASVFPLEVEPEVES